MTMSDKIQWTPEAEKAFCTLKMAMSSAEVLALPNYSKPFIQMADVREGCMTSVLTQRHGDKLRPVAYYSTKLDPVAQAMPACVQAIVAAALAVQASAELVLFHNLTLRVPHSSVMSLTTVKHGIFITSTPFKLYGDIIITTPPHHRTMLYTKPSITYADSNRRGKT